MSPSTPLPCHYYSFALSTEFDVSNLSFCRFPYSLNFTSNFGWIWLKHLAETLLLHEARMLCIIMRKCKPLRGLLLLKQGLSLRVGK